MTIITRTILLAPLLALTLSAEDQKPAPTVEQLQAKVAILEAKLASLQADHKLLTLTFSYEMQLCQAVDLSQAKVAAAEAKRKVEETMPKGR